MLFLRSLVFNLFFLLWGSFVLVTCLPVLLARPADAFYVGRLWVRVMLTALRILCGLGYEIRGRENLPRTPCIIASKHQSSWDTYIMALTVECPAMVLKRELLRIPIFGWYLTKGHMVPIDRDGGASALKTMINRAKACVAEERSIVIYPEGTRSAPGERQPYHPGVYALYKQLDLPTVPIALNSGLFWGRKTFIKRPGKILLEILPPIAPGLDRKTYLARLEQTIEEASDRLIAEATTGSRQPAADAEQSSRART